MSCVVKKARARQGGLTCGWATSSRTSPRRGARSGGRGSAGSVHPGFPTGWPPGARRWHRCRPAPPTAGACPPGHRAPAPFVVARCRGANTDTRSSSAVGSSSRIGPRGVDGNTTGGDVVRSWSSFSPSHATSLGSIVLALTTMIRGSAESPSSSVIMNPRPPESTATGRSFVGSCSCGTRTPLLFISLRSFRARSRPGRHLRSRQPAALVQRVGPPERLPEGAHPLGRLRLQRQRRELPSDPRAHLEDRLPQGRGLRPDRARRRGCDRDPPVH